MGFECIEFTKDFALTISKVSFVWRFNRIPTINDFTADIFLEKYFPFSTDFDFITVEEKL